MGYKLIYKDNNVLIMTNDEFTEGSIIDIIGNEKSIQRKIYFDTQAGDLYFIYRNMKYYYSMFVDVE